MNTPNYTGIDVWELCIPKLIVGLLIVGILYLLFSRNKKGGCWMIIIAAFLAAVPFLDIFSSVGAVFKMAYDNKDWGTMAGALAFIVALATGAALLLRWFLNRIRPR